MKANIRSIGSGGLLLAAALGFNQAALAAPCPVTQTLDEFIALGAGGCDIDDALQFSYINDTIADNGNAIIQITEPVPGVYNFSTDFEASLTAEDTGELLDFAVSIIGDLVFQSVSIDSDVPGATPGVTVTKTVDDEDGTIGTGAQATVISVNGGPDGPDPLCDDCTTILVRDLYEIASTGSLNGITNTFDLRPPQQIPAPGGLALLGLGLVGLGMVRRRKSAA